MATGIVIKLNGVTFDGRQEVIKELYDLQDSNEVKLKFEHEPDNTYDPNAIAVYGNGKQVGYIPKEIAKQIVGDSKKFSYLFKFDEIVPGSEDGEIPWGMKVKMFRCKKR